MSNDEWIYSKVGNAEAKFHKESKVIIAVGFSGRIYDVDRAVYNLGSMIRSWEETHTPKVIPRHSFTHEHEGNCRCIKMCKICGLPPRECKLRYGQPPHNFHGSQPSSVFCRSCGLSYNNHVATYGPDSPERV